MNNSKKVYTQEQAYKIADKRVRNKIIYWDDLPDVNSLWDYVWEGMTMEEIIENADDAYLERLHESGMDVCYF